ncbi:MAG: polysaccharide biosynthesis C-terminal domain-containing protein [Bacteroidetes bacterium]|nr:polysaccharide biosynthesis C-terminal domain-containing protein [Bacteroidota bacterium]
MNLAINLFLIPIYGIYGAAVATTISFVFLLGITLWRTRKILPIRFNWVLIGQALLATALMAVPLAVLQLDNLVLDMIVKISIGATIYIGVLTGLSSEVRGRVRDQELRGLREHPARLFWESRLESCLCFAVRASIFVIRSLRFVLRASCFGSE